MGHTPIKAKDLSRDTMQSMCTPQKLSLEFHIEASKFLCVSRGKKCSFFGKFGIFCFLETLVFRIAILPYYWRIMLNAESPEQYPFLKPAPLAVSSRSFSSELLKIHLNFSSSKFFWAWFLFVGWCFVSTEENYHISALKHQASSKYRPLTCPAPLTLRSE